MATSKNEGLVKLVSRLNHPVTIRYGNDNIQVPPRGTANKLKKSKLGEYPNGISEIVLKD